MQWMIATRDKQAVRDFWNDAACGERLYLSGTDRRAYEGQSRVRYELEPYIPDFASFSASEGLRVLEIGIGLGADHQRFAEEGALLWGLDLTQRAVEHTHRRLAAFGLESRLFVGDAERLPFKDGVFDVVYSWGALHHTPDTPAAVGEVRRVLRTGGRARAMIYHRWSLVGIMLWTRYALLRARPWRSLAYVYAHHLESPGTKAYSVKEARELFSGFSEVNIRTVLTHGDLLESEAGQRHRGFLLSCARRIWPRSLIRRLFPGAGLFMLIDARK